MEYIAWPAVVGVSELELHLEYPGRFISQSPYSAQQITVLRNTGLWAGTVTLAENPPGEDSGRKIEAFIHGLSNGDKWSLMPHHRSSVEIPSGGARFVKNSEGFIGRIPQWENMVGNAADQIGRMCRVKGRTYIIHGERGDEFLVSPEDNLSRLTTGDFIHASSRLAVKADLTTTEFIQTLRTPDFRGPWALTFTEALTSERGTQDQFLLWEDGDDDRLIWHTAGGVDGRVLWWH